MCEGSIETVECIWVNIWCTNWYTPFTYSWPTNEEHKKWDAVCISNRGSDID